MRIGFDLDKVFISTPPLIPENFIVKLYGTKTNGILKYRIPSIPEQLIRKISHYPLFRPGIKDNLKFIASVPKPEHKLYLISSRFGFLKKQTNKIIRKYKLDDIFDELYFNYDNEQPHIYKYNLLKKLSLDKFVDDDLYLLKYIASKNNRTKFYWFNKKINKKISNNIHALTNLADLFNH